MIIIDPEMCQNEVCSFATLRSTGMGLFGSRPFFPFKKGGEWPQGSGDQQFSPSRDTEKLPHIGFSSVKRDDGPMEATIMIDDRRDTLLCPSKIKQVKFSFGII